MARYTDVDYDRDRRNRDWEHGRRSEFEPGSYGRNWNDDRYSMRDRNYDYYTPGGFENYGYDRDENRDRNRWGRSENERYDRDHDRSRSYGGAYEHNDRNYYNRGSTWNDRDYDRSYGRYDRDYDREQSRNWDYNDRSRPYGDRDWNRNYDRGWNRGYDRDNDYNRNRDWSRERDEDRGFWDRAGDEVRSWFGDEDADRRRRSDHVNERRSGYRTERRRYYEPHDAW